MFAIIFGRLNDPFCVGATQLAEKLREERDDFTFKYVDIHTEGITKADLEKTIGQPVVTLPVIVIDEQYIGGLNDFDKYIKEL